MKAKLILLAACIAAIIALALPSQADALQAATYYRSVSTPVVSEVTTNGSQYVATIEAHASRILVYHGKKKVHVDRVGKTVWMLRVERNKTYTIKAKANDGVHTIKWRLVK